MRFKATLRLDSTGRDGAILDKVLLMFHRAINVDDVVFNAWLWLALAERPRGELAPLAVLTAIHHHATVDATSDSTSTLRVVLFQLQWHVLKR